MSWKVELHAANQLKSLEILAFRHGSTAINVVLCITTFITRSTTNGIYQSTETGA